MFLRSLLPAFLWALLILIICGIPGQRLPSMSFLNWLKPDKLVHLFVYAVLCYLLLKGFLAQESYPSLRSNAGKIAVISGICYGVLIEVLQQYVFIDRSGEIYDALANAAGVLIGFRFFLFRRKKQSGKNPSSS